jgi:proton-translocating NADH-quinone oxidoreductase chain L
VAGQSHGAQQPWVDASKACYTWFQAGNVNVSVTLRADALTAVMLVTVTFVGSFIVLFSVGYMHGDPGYARYFAEVALFIAAMTGLVLADNFVVLYACWEGVGLCSYLLIGFWYAKPSAAAAARKAFLVTRIGDVGLLIGILLLWASSGYAVDYDSVFKDPAAMGSGVLTTACLLLFCGAAGKSAQFPLHVWLPDAMEGPTPISALIHAATMVTAGVYLVARCTPLFVLAPDAQIVVAVIGCFTALLAAVIALTQNDLKRVLAYSTVSQLGYMFLALGSAKLNASLVLFAVVAAIFHLFTHAFFKALLFLASGSVMHAMGNVIDMRRFGGLRFALPTTHWTFLCGALALAGFPFVTAGFWSKDEILAATYLASEGGHYAGVYAMLFLAALFTAGLTAFYTFRAYFKTFWGELRVPAEAGEHVHESPPVMTIPLIVLAVGAVATGFVNAAPWTHWLADFLEKSRHANVSPGATVSVAHAWFWVISGAITLAGIGVAWLLYVLLPALPDRLSALARHLYQLSLHKFYLDELYAFLIVRPLEWLAKACRVIDQYLVDGLVDLIGQMPPLVSRVLQPIQNGLVQFYALAMALALTLFLAVLVWRYGV